MANIGSAPHGLNHEVGLIVQSSTGIRTDKMVELYADPTTHRLLVDAGTVSGAGTIGATVPTSGEYIGVNVGGILDGLSGKGLGLNIAADVAVVDQNGNQINSLPGALDVNLKQVSPFVTRNGPSFQLKGQKFRFVGFNYYPLIIGSTKTQMQTLMDDAKAKGITVLRTWCFDPYGGFRSLVYPIGTNLVSNGDFETNTTGWTLGTDFTRSNDTAESGSWSIKQVSAGGFSALDSVAITVVANTNYVLTFWHKTQNVSGFPNIVFVGTTPGSNDIKDGGFISDTAGIWVQQQVLFNSGANTSLYLHFGNFGGTVNAYFDKISLSVQSGTPYLGYNEPALIQIDTALDEARKRGIKLILDLGDGNYNNYNTPGQYVSWVNTIYGDNLPTDVNNVDYAFFGSTHCKNLYKDFINTLVKRKNTINGIQFKDDPAIFSWELGNELRTNHFDPGNLVNSLNAPNLILLSKPGGWADEMSTYIKSIDPNHMVNFGDMAHEWTYLQDSNGVGDVIFNGTYQGVSYSLLSALPNIDFADFHLYPTQDDGIHLAAGGGKYWGQNFGYNTGVSGDGLRAQLKDYVSVAHANNKPAVITEVGFLQGTTGDNTYYPLYNRYNAFQAIFKDFLDIPNGDGVVIWHAVAAATSASYDIALEATGGAGVTDNSNDTDIVTLINTYNTAFLTDVTPSQAVTGLIKVNGDVISKNLNFNDSTVSIQLSDTWTGTVQFEYTIDGITWYSLSLKDNTGTAVTSATAVGLFTGAIAGMNKVRVRASAAITGSLTVNIQSSTGVNASTSSGGGGTQYTDAGTPPAHPIGDALVFDNGSSAWQAVNSTHGLPVNIVAGAGSGGTALADNAAFTASTTNFTPAGGFYHSTIDAVTDGHAAALAIDAKRNLFTVLRDAAGNARGANINASNQLSVSVDNTPTVDTELPAAAALTDSMTNPTAPAVAAHLMIWNSSTWTRVQEVDAAGDASNAAGIMRTGVALWNGTTYDRIRGDTTSGVWVNVKNNPVLGAGSNTIGTVKIVGNAGGIVDAAGQNALVPANYLVMGGQFNQTPNTVSNTNVTPLQLDSMGSLKIVPGLNAVTLNPWNSATSLNVTQTIYINSGVPAVLVQLVQTSTLTAGAVTFEASYDGTNFVTIAADQVLDPTSATLAQISLPYTVQASTNKPFLILTHGAQSLRVKLSTQITGTGAVTPNYALLPVTNVHEMIAFSPTAANFNVTVGGSLPAGTNVIGHVINDASTAVIGHVIVDTAPSTAVTNAGTFAVQATPVTQADTFMLGGVNIKEINAVTPLMGNGATGTGSLRVTIASDNTVLPGVGAGATGAAVPANASYDGGIAKTALPAAATDGNLTGKMVDKFGRQVVMLNGMRDIILPMTQLTLTSTTTETTLITAVASTFLDITSLVVINTSATATQVDFRDSTTGTIRLSLYVPAGDTRGATGLFLPQNAVNTNWTAKCVTSVASVIITGTYITNK